MRDSLGLVETTALEPCSFSRSSYLRFLVCELAAGHDGPHTRNGRPFKPGVYDCFGRRIDRGGLRR
jgi:hypothetical protein